MMLMEWEKEELRWVYEEKPEENCREGRFDIELDLGKDMAWTQHGQRRERSESKLDQWKGRKVSVAEGDFDNQIEGDGILIATSPEYMWANTISTHFDITNLSPNSSNARYKAQASQVHEQYQQQLASTDTMVWNFIDSSISKADSQLKQMPMGNKNNSNYNLQDMRSTYETNNQLPYSPQNGLAARRRHSISITDSNSQVCILKLMFKIFDNRISFERYIDKRELFTQRTQSLAIIIAGYWPGNLYAAANNAITDSKSCHTNGSSSI